MKDLPKTHNIKKKTNEIYRPAKELYDASDAIIGTETQDTVEKLKNNIEELINLENLKFLLTSPILEINRSISKSTVQISIDEDKLTDQLYISETLNAIVSAVELILNEACDFLDFSQDKQLIKIEIKDIFSPLAKLLDDIEKIRALEIGTSPYVC